MVRQQIIIIIVRKFTRDELLDRKNDSKEQKDYHIVLKITFHPVLRRVGNILGETHLSFTHNYCHKKVF